MYTFPVVEKSLNNIFNIEHIHPRKQRLVREILKEIPTFSVFGSSVRWDCNEKSDIDLLVDGSEIGMTKEKVFNILVRIVNGDFDLLWKDEIANELSTKVKENILDRSVKVYER